MLSIVPTAELPWYRVTWDRRHESHRGEAFDEHAPLVEELLEPDARRTGRSRRRDVAPREAIDWYWRPTNQVRALLEALAEAGIISIVRREGNRRVYDLTERLFPADLLARRLPERRAAPAQAAVAVPRQRAAGRDGRVHAVRRDWARRRSARALRNELVEMGAITPVAVEGLRGQRFVVADEVPMLDAAELEVAGEAAAGAAAAGRLRAGRGVRRAARPAGLGPRPARAAVRVRVPLGGLRARRPSGARATTSCRCCTATGSWAGSSRGSTGRRARCGCSACGGRTGSTRSARPGSRRFAGLRRDGVRCADGACAGRTLARSPAVHRAPTRWHRARRGRVRLARIRAIRCAAGSRRRRAASERVGRRRRKGPRGEARDQPAPAILPIIPAATVLLLASSTRMKRRSRGSRGTGRRTAAASRAAGSGRSR